MLACGSLSALVTSFKVADSAGPAFRAALEQAIKGFATASFPECAQLEREVAGRSKSWVVQV